MNRETDNAPGGFSAKITEQHLQRQAVLYVRQSTSAQLREHQESTARQYALKQRLAALGWPEQRVIVIDDDLGVSGAGKVQRPGFRRLLKLVTEGQVGIVLGLEMSRLARNSKDWHDLFEVCAIFHALIADEDGVFEPHDPNDRLVLGMKGILSELELHTMKVRLERGRLNKAQRGELFHRVPVGYILDEQGLPQLDPDESARHVMQMFFRQFEVLGSSHALFHYLAEHNIQLPFRRNVRDRNGKIDWRLAAKSTVYELLRHPLYAGAYGYGTHANYRNKTREKNTPKHLPPEQWKVFIKDRHPAYISWEQYENNRRRLLENDNRGDRNGPVRGGSALLAGLVRCTACGRRLPVSYPHRGHPLYYCNRHHTVANAEPCFSSIRCQILDELVTSQLLEVLAPAGVELSLRVIEDEQTRREQWETLHVHRLEQANYAVELAERRYQEVDPANRLVAGRLEQQWEAALIQQKAAQTALDQLRQEQPICLRASEREQLRNACADIASLWRGAASLEDRQQIVRLLLERVEVEAPTQSEQVRVRLHWSGGFETLHDGTRTVQQYCQMDCYDRLLDRLLELTLSGVRISKVAEILASEGFRSPRHNRPILAATLQKLLLENPRCQEQLRNPTLEPDHWLSGDLAKELGIPEKRLKFWVTRGWVRALQRPYGRVWVIYADANELDRLRQLVASQTGQGRPCPPEKLRTPASVPRKS